MSMGSATLLSTVSPPNPHRADAALTTAQFRHDAMTTSIQDPKERVSDNLEQLVSAAANSDSGPRESCPLGGRTLKC